MGLGSWGGGGRVQGKWFGRTATRKDKPTGVPDTRAHSHLGASPEVMVSGIEGTRTFSAFPPFFLAGLLTVFPADFHNILVMLLYVCIYLFISKMPQVFPNKSLKERTGKKARKQSWAQSQRSLTTAVAGRAQEAACT